MRQALNGNPVAQVAVIGILALVAGFFLLRMGGSSATEEEAPAAATAPAATGEAPVPGAATTDPATGIPLAPAPTGTPTGETGEFTAGPGLPKTVTEAYEDGKTVVLIVTRLRGVDDPRLRHTVRALRSRSSVALFTSVAKHTARYSRITQGVELDRVPALIVLSPRSASDGPVPTASVSYGFRSAQSVEQAVRDAGYKGPQLDYHP